MKPKSSDFTRFDPVESHIQPRTFGFTSVEDPYQPTTFLRNRQLVHPVGLPDDSYANQSGTDRDSRFARRWIDYLRCGNANRNAWNATIPKRSFP